jgi:hypothetical protein
MTDRRFPPPWTIERIPGGFKVCDANGQLLAYVYSREVPADADMAKVLTEDEARRIASNIAKLQVLLGGSQSVGPRSQPARKRMRQRGLLRDAPERGDGPARTLHREG